MYKEKKFNKHDLILTPLLLSSDGSKRIIMNFDSNSASLLIRFAKNNFANPSHARNFTS